MTIKIEADTVVISNNEPDQEVIFRYNAGTERVRIHAREGDIEQEMGVTQDLGVLIQALTAIKNTQDNERRRMR